MTRWRRWLCLTCCLGAGVASAQGPTDPVTALKTLQADGLWGELTLADGRTRQVEVDSLTTDSVIVRQVVGALQVRPAIYALEAIRSVRSLGVQRISQRLAPYRPPRSSSRALALEMLIPGAGYFYAGNARQGWTLLGFTALVGATAVGVGNDGLAGWLPLAVWIKTASLMDLYDQVQADAAAHRARTEGLTWRGGSVSPRPTATVSLFRARLRF